jgi:hypothetical protein
MVSYGDGEGQLIRVLDVPVCLCRRSPYDEKVETSTLRQVTRPFGRKSVIPCPRAQTLNVKHGLFIMENLATEVIAHAGLTEFLFCLTHHKTRGSTGAVIAPAAVI